MNIKKSIGLSLIAITMLLSGCKKFLEDYSQDTIYVRTWKDLNEVLLGDCYLPVNGAGGLASSGDHGIYLHFMGDELQESLTAYANSSDNMKFDDQAQIFGFFTWQQRTDQSEDNSGFIKNFDDWAKIYKLINVANNVITSIQKVPNTSDTDKAGVTKVNGEAHFLRAAYYFWLVNLYGKPYNQTTAATDPAVPIKLTDNVEDLKFQRNTVQECYDQILKDLEVAETDLLQSGRSTTLYRADFLAVRFLLSRVHLYMQHWTLASDYAQKVIQGNSALVNLNTSTGAILTKASVENIFSMGGNSLPVIISYAFKSFRVSDDLYNSYDNNDLRKTNFFWKDGEFIGYTKVAEVNPNNVSKTQNTYYASAYSQTWPGKKSEVSDRFLFRSAEAYLIKAEAQAYLGNEAVARESLNTLRANRYTTGSEYLVTSGGNALVTAIRNERRKELALEGQRWFDLRRYTVCEKYPESHAISHDYYFYAGRNSSVKIRYNTYTLQPNDAAYTLPIPYEVAVFNNMTNNDRPVRSFTQTNF